MYCSLARTRIARTAAVRLPSTIVVNMGHVTVRISFWRHRPRPLLAHPSTSAAAAVVVVDCVAMMACCGGADVDTIILQESRWWKFVVVNWIWLVLKVEQLGGEIWLVYMSVYSSSFLLSHYVVVLQLIGCYYNCSCFCRYFLNHSDTARALFPADRCFWYYPQFHTFWDFRGSDLFYAL